MCSACDSGHMQTRLIGVTVVFVAIAGCSAVPLGGDGLAFESGATVIENESLADEGYELHYEETRTFNETVSASGGGDGNETRIVISNHVAQYGGQSDLPAGVGTVRLGVVTTPEVSVAGRRLNPLLTGDHDRVFRYLPETDSQGFEQYGNYTIEPFGEPVNVTVLATETDGDEVPTAFVHLMRAPRPDTGDTVVAYGAYPAEADEANSIARLFLSLEYTPPSDVNDSVEGGADAGSDADTGSNGGFGPEIPFSTRAERSGTNG